MGNPQRLKSGQIEPVNKTFQKSTASIRMWVVQASLLTRQMTLYFWTVTSAMLHFHHIWFAFSWKIASKYLSNTLCSCRMTFPPPNCWESMQYSQRHAGFSVLRILFIVFLFWGQSSRFSTLFSCALFIFNHRLSFLNVCVLNIFMSQLFTID